MDFAVIWPNKFLSGEFRGNGHYMVKSVGLVAIRMNKFLSGEFRVFHRKVVIGGFGCCHGDLVVNKMWQDKIRTICVIDWVVSFR